LAPAHFSRDHPGPDAGIASAGCRYGEATPGEDDQFPAGAGCAMCAVDAEGAFRRVFLEGNPLGIHSTDFYGVAMWLK
jgi:hypothetical protein